MVQFPQEFRCERLRREHPRTTFASGQAAVDAWGAKQALQNQEKHLSVAWVLVDEQDRIAGFYTLATGQVDFGDLMIFGHEERHAIEVKNRRDTETEALDQVARYLDRAGLGEGWLLMFDLRKEASWVDKLFVREVEYAAKKIRIVGC